MLTDRTLDSWIQAGLNVLLVGQHGIGKTERVLEGLKRNNMKYLYFSASTMDPFVDLIGIPRVIENDAGARHLDFVKTKQVADADYNYIVIDEYNRSHKKVRNALMECVQFKSLNGVPLPNLKGVIAMINPPDDEDTYDVEKLDPAQEDRFHIKVSLPNGPSKEYFKKKYNEMGDIACTWWTTIDAKLRNKGIVSPRRLDYALNLYNKGIDIEDVLPKEVNVKQLKTELAKAGLSGKLPELKKMNVDALKKELAGNGNLRELVLTHIVGGTFPIASIDAFGDEEITKSAEHSRVATYIQEKITKDDERYLSVGRSVANFANSSNRALSEAGKAIARTIMSAEQVKLRKISAEERKAGMSNEEVKRRLGDIAKPSTTEEEIDKIITEHRDAIVAEAQLISMMSRMAQIRPQSSIRAVCKRLAIPIT